jgi:hypothetical protein
VMLGVHGHRLFNDVVLFENDTISLVSKPL